jgi:hypothetical protein
LATSYAQVYPGDRRPQLALAVRHGEQHGQLGPAGRLRLRGIRRYDRRDHEADEAGCLVGCIAFMAALGEGVTAP